MYGPSIFQVSHESNCLTPNSPFLLTNGIYVQKSLRRMLSTSVTSIDEWMLCIICRNLGRPVHGIAHDNNICVTIDSSDSISQRLSLGRRTAGCIRYRDNSGSQSV